jgi:pimeloyl-ACP methyl ester carboxylesterase
MTCDMSSRAKAWVLVVAVAFLAAGSILSHRLDPGIRVKTITLAGKFPALQFIPDAPGPHPVALLGHGFSATKETMFRFAEALAHAGFVCYSVDFPGHGASPQALSLEAIAQTPAEVARALGSVDVFIGHSMGAGAGGIAVREKGFRPRLFIAVGGDPSLGENAPPLLLLAGRFEEFVRLSALKARTDARLVVSPWSDHALELCDPYLVRAAVEAACTVVGATPPPAGTAWIWRSAGLLLAILGAAGLMFFCQLTPRLASARAVLIPAIIILTIILATGTFAGSAPQLRRVVLQLALAILLGWTLITLAKWHIPRWTLPALGAVISLALLALIVFGGKGTVPAVRLGFIVAAITTFLLLIATGLGWFVARRTTRRDGDLATAILAAYLIGQWMPRFI